MQKTSECSIYMFTHGNLHSFKTQTWHVSKHNLWRHSFVVIVFFSMSRHIGHMSSLCKLRGDTAISVPSVIASCGVRCSSYKLNSQVLLDTAAYSILKRRPRPFSCSLSDF